MKTIKLSEPEKEFLKANLTELHRLETIIRNNVNDHHHFNVADLKTDCETIRKIAGNIEHFDAPY